MYVNSAFSRMTTVFTCLGQHMTGDKFVEHPLYKSKEVDTRQDHLCLVSLFWGQSNVISLFGNSQHLPHFCSSSQVATRKSLFPKWAIKLVWRCLKQCTYGNNYEIEQDNGCPLINSYFKWTRASEGFVISGLCSLKIPVYFLPSMWHSLSYPSYIYIQYPLVTTYTNACTVLYVFSRYSLIIQLLINYKMTRLISSLPHMPNKSLLKS